MMQEIIMTRAGKMDSNQDSNPTRERKPKKSKSSSLVDNQTSLKMEI